MSSPDLTPVESAVLRCLLAGKEPVLLALQHQLESASIAARDITGHGFHLHFSVPGDVERLHRRFRIKSDFCFGDVEMSTDSLERGAGFLLWITGGALGFLEGYTYDERWPTNVLAFTLRYIGGGKRDMHTLRQQWEVDG